MIRLEQVVNQMSPLIDTELERVDRKHAQLTQLSSDLVDAINLYHSLMRDSDRPMSGGFPMGFPPGQMAYAGAGPISLPPMYGNQMFHHGMMPGMQQQYPAGFGPPHLDNMQNMQSMPNMQNGHAPQFIPQQGGFPSQMIPPQTVSQMAPPPQQQPIQMQQPQLNVQGMFKTHFALEMNVLKLKYF